MEKHDQWKNQNGFSLVELVVVMAILSIMGTVLYGFFHTSTRSYKDTGAEVDLQYEAQLTQNQLDNLIIDSTKELLYTYDTLSSNNNIVLSDAQIDNKSEVTQKNFIIDNGDEVYTLQWDLSTSKINLLKTITKADGSRETSSPSLLAEYVKEFDVNLERVAKQRVVEFRFLYENSGKTLEIKHNITLRNRVHVNKVGSDSDVLLQTVVDEVLIYEDMHDNSFKEENKITVPKELKKGEKIDLIAKVIGKNYPSQEVIWTLIETPTDSSTKLTITGKNTCTFEIGPNETNKVYQIKAVSVADSSKSATIKIILPPDSDRIPGGKGFVRGGPGYVMDLEDLGVDMSQVASVEWGFIDAMIVEGNGLVTRLDRTNTWNTTRFKVPMNQIWKPLEEGQTDNELEKMYSSDSDSYEKLMTLTPDSENLGKCLVKAGANYADEWALPGIEAFQAVVLAKVTYKDGRVETKQFGQPLKNEDLADPVKRAEVRNNPLFLDCVCVKLVKPDGDEFYDYENVQDHQKTSGTTHAVLQMKDSDSLQFRIDGYGLYALPEFKCTDESKLTDLLENYSFDPATGDVYMKARPGAKGNLTFCITMPGGFQYTVPVEVGALQTSQ